MASTPVRAALKGAGIKFGAAGKMSKEEKAEKFAAVGMNSKGERPKSTHERKGYWDSIGEGNLRRSNNPTARNLARQAGSISSAAFGAYDNPQSVGSGGNRPKRINTNSTRISDYRRYSYTGMAKPTLDRVPAR